MKDWHKGVKIAGYSNFYPLTKPPLLFENRNMANDKNGDIIKELHKYETVPEIKVEAKEGQREHLCSNNVDLRCPSLVFNSNSKLVSDEMALDYLANILVRIFLSQQKEYVEHIKREQ